MKIKYIGIYLLTILLMVNTAQAQSSGLLKILDDLEEKEGITSVLVTKKMFELFTKTTDIEVEGESLNEVIGSLEKLLIYEVDLSSYERNTIANKITSMLDDDGYEILMKINEDGDDVEIYILEEKDMVKHLFLMAKDKSSLQIISLIGDIDLAKISKLSGTLNIKELEHLNKNK